MVQFLEGRNRAWAQLDAPINGSDTNVALVAWQGSRLSDVTTASGRKVRAQIYERDPDTGAITKCELVNITNNVSDVLIIERTVESTRATDTTNAYAATPQSFTADAIIEEVISSEVLSEIQDEVNRIVDEELPLLITKEEYNNERVPFIASSAWDDDYEITSADITTYENGRTFKVQADVPNTGPATLKLNALSAKSLKKLSSGAFTALATWDIIANQIFWATYNQNEDCFQFSVDPATAIVSDVSKLTDTTYPNWEDLTAWNAVFLEPSATFAQATSVRNIGDVTGNTRVSLPCFWAWVSASTLKLALKKFVSPSVSLGIRIETDDGSGNPSGTLAHANATATVTAWSLTTSLADTTITFAGAFTLTAWIRYHIVCFQGTYGTETINGTNYYWIGYYTNNSTTRQLKMWDGSSWSYDYSSVGSTDITLAWSSQQNNTTSNTLWLQYLAVKDVFINTITKNVNCTATKAYIKSDGGTLLDTMTFSGNVATPTTAIKFTAWTYFRIEVDNNGASYTNRREQSPTTYPQTWTDLAITSNSLNGANDPVGNQNNSVLTVNTGVATLVNTFPYSSSSLFYDAVLSKTSATYSYKIDWHGICSETKTVWQFPKITVCGIDSNQSGMTLGATQYLSNTAWVIAWSAWANSKKIGKAISSTQIKIIDIPL